MNNRITPYELMQQAGLTANTWLLHAMENTKDLGFSKSDRARIVAAMITASAQDQHTCHMLNNTADLVSAIEGG